MAARKPRTATAAVGIDVGDLEPTTEQAAGDKPLPFHRVYSASIKGGVDSKLGPCTAVVGANRAGKTAVLDAIRLALTGTHPVGAHYADLLALTGGRPPDAHLVGVSAEAHATTPSGRKSLDVAHSGALSRLTPAQQAALLPLASIRDLLALGSDKAREAIFARFGTATAMPTPPGLDEAQTQLWLDLASQAEGKDAASRLSSMGTLLRSQKLAFGKVAKTNEEEAEGLRATAPAIPPTKDEIDALEKQLADAMAYSRSESLRLQLRQASDSLSEAVGSPEMPLPADVDLSGLAPIDTEIAQIDEQLQQAVRRHVGASLIDRIRGQIVSRATHSCVACAQPVSEAVVQALASTPSLEQAATAQVAQFNARRADLLAAKSSLMELAQRTRLEAQKAQQHNANRTQKINMLQSVVTNLQSALRGVTDCAVSVGEAQEALRAANEGRAMVGRIDDCLRRSRKAHRDAEDCKVLEKAASAILSQLVAGVASKAEAAVRKYLPSESFSARLALEDAEGKPACRWEVKGADGTYHPFGAASGAEWGALVVALGCAWTEGAPVRILLLDDADLAPLSPANVASLLEKVRERVEAGDLTQAVVAWCRPEEVPENWTVVQR